MIAIIDYNAGNIRSVENALARLGCEYELTADPGRIRAADKVILPGVGNAAAAVSELRDRGLVPVIRSLRRPVLGICVGLQVLCCDSEEGPCEGLGLFDAHVRRFPTSAAKVPHMGWNEIGNLDGKLFRDLKGGSYVYFVHSYYPTLGPDTIATCRHGDVLFSAALKYENFYGTQFHPEKSGAVGEQILRNFLSI
jgi:glutamine amidotransferase